MSASPNPRIFKIEIGTRDLRTVTVYPISYGQKITSKAFNSFAEIFDGLTVGDVDVEKMSLSKTMIGVVKNHLSELIHLATEEENLIDEIDGTQMVELIEILWVQNFKPYEKKIREILDHIRGGGRVGKSESNTPSVSSLRDIPDTTSATSTSDQQKTAD